MNRILLGLIGVGVGAAFAFAFIAKVNVTKISATDVTITIAFLVLLAACSLALHVSPWGRRIKKRLDAADDRARIKARDEGAVRRPPWWNLWP